VLAVIEERKHLRKK